MRDAQAIDPVGGSVSGNGLFDEIGRFLDTHALGTDPAYYAFAYAVVSAPDGALAQAVARLTEQGVRLTRHDIERLGGSVGDAVGMQGEVGDGAPHRDRPAPSGRRIERNTEADTAVALVAETQQQVDGFARIMRTIRDETHGFGCELARSAAAISQLAELDQITQITGSMIARIHDSEVRLARATAEAETLRGKLAEARDTARRDVLTGLPNRRAFDEAFRNRRDHDAPFCLAVCDIDRFKRINDSHGHPIGDRVLSAVARTLSEECNGHLVVRHGGEEFAVLLHGLTLADAAAHLDGARNVVAHKRFRMRETDKPLGQVTLSVGVTAVQGGEDIAAAFERADRLLYTAKSEGRDRVCAA